MEIKIPGRPAGSSEIEAVKEGAEAIEGRENVGDVGEIAPPQQDTVTRIASQLADGTLTKAEAVEQLLAHTMGSGAVQSVPEHIRSEIEDVLHAMLETDPHLKSLVAALGPDEQG